MKFFKKRLNKRKLTTPINHQHDNNKPLPPSPSFTSLPQLAPTVALAANDVEATNNDSWLQLNLPNDFSSSLDIPQLQHHQDKEISSNNKIEINTGKSPSQEAENITETSSFSYPNNYIDTAIHNEPNEPESTRTLVTALESSNFSASPGDLDKDSKREKSPLQPAERQGDILLDDTSRDATVLVDATLIPTADMQQTKLGEKDELTVKEYDEEKEQVKVAVVEFDVFQSSRVRATTSTSMSTSTLASTSAPASVVIELDTENTTVIERGGDVEGIVETDRHTLAEQEALQIALPVNKCDIENENPSNVLMAEPLTPTTSSPSTIIPLSTTEPSSQTASPEISPEDLQRPTSKLAKRKSAVSLIPRKQQPVNLPDTIVKRDGRRASSGSFIPVLVTRHQHQTSTICPVQSKEVLTTAPMTWSPSSSSERNSVSSDSASSCSSQHQEKRMSLIAKPSTTQQHLQSKIPKASFGMPLTVNTEISKVLTTQQHVSRLPTKRNSTLV